MTEGTVESESFRERPNTREEVDVARRAAPRRAPRTAVAVDVVRKNRSGCKGGIGGGGADSCVRERSTDGWKK